MQLREICRLALITGGVLLLSGAALQARPLPNGGVTADEVAEVMRADKFAVEPGTDRGGDPLIYSTAAGRRFGVYFYQCKNKRCTSIQFAARFDMTADKLARVPEWNRTKRFGRAYLGADAGSVFVEMDMDVERGATTEALSNNFERWVAVVEQFPKFFQ